MKKQYGKTYHPDSALRDFTKHPKNQEAKTYSGNNFKDQKVKTYIKPHPEVYQRKFQQDQPCPP
jgi:hypothetical protein